MYHLTIEFKEVIGSETTTLSGAEYKITDWQAALNFYMAANKPLEAVINLNIASIRVGRAERNYESAPDDSGMEKARPLLDEAQTAYALVKVEYDKVAGK